MDPVWLKSWMKKMKRTVARGMTPVVLVACGSFSPITALHLRIFEDARASLRAQNMDVVLGVLSPVHDRYGKKSLVDAKDRIEMVRLAVEDSNFLTVGTWETEQADWTPTCDTLTYYAKCLAQVPVRFRTEEEEAAIDEALVRGDEPLPLPEPQDDDERLQTGLVKTMLICGSDLLETFPNIRDDGKPLWDPVHQTSLLRHGLVCIERQGSDLAQFIKAHAVFQQPDVHIHVVQPRAYNTISSSAVRACLQKNESIKYMVPDPVIKYIMQHRVHKEPQWRA